MKIDKPITIDLTTFLFALTILAILLTPNISIAKKIENSSNSLLFKNTSNILAFNKKDTSQKQDCHCLKDQPKIKLSEITYEDAGRRLKNNPISAYQFFREKGVPLSKVLPTMIGKIVSPNQFKDLTQFNEDYSAVLPNGIPKGLRMYDVVSILNTTKEKQLKDAEKGVKALEKLEKYFETYKDAYMASMDLGKANWYKRAALQTKKQIDKLKAYIAKLKQLIKEGKTDVKVKPPAILGFGVVKDYVAVVGNWLIEIDPTTGISMYQIKQTARLAGSGQVGEEVSYTPQQLKQLMESDTFFMGLGAGYVTSDGVGVIQTPDGQPMGYVITKEMIGRLFNIDFNSLSLNERVQKIYELIQNGDISFGLLRGNRLLSVEIHHDGITSSLICYLEPHENRNADWGYIYQPDASATHVLRVEDTETGREYYMLVGGYEPLDDGKGSTIGYGYIVVLLQYNTEEPKNNMPQYASADTNCAAYPQFIRLLTAAVPVNKAQLKNK